LLFITPFGLGEFIQTNWTAIPLNMVMKIGYILVFTSFLVYLLNAYAIQHSGPTLAGLYIYLQPILVIFFALFFSAIGLSADYTNTITWAKIGYMLLIFSGVYLTTRPSK
jgi:drug/metabolite transporter (DMT)-like permease